MSDTVANNAVAVICDGNDIDTKTLKERIFGALAQKGIASWPVTEAEIFTYRDKTLILARPLPPLKSHPFSSATRLKRKSRPISD